ncbi:uncharacterized protein TNCV_1357981 [Trichonephila clavipes]|uniref:Uncharacterized protein n=1 Tax=Trichonephila clavipes TaxID=2585209 RepID=A0A8X6V832_TRICX|nr:uncharacterized protein TNCV_1357981 [Trichonephila clavipes]
MAVGDSLPHMNLGVQGGTQGGFRRRALDSFEVLSYRVVEERTTDYAHLKQALTEQFPVFRNRSELETRFYASSQKPSDFLYHLLKIHKQLKLDMKEENLLDHVISRLEPQILDYVEDNWRFDSRRQGGQPDHGFHNQGGQQGGSRNVAFRDQPWLTHVLYNEIDTGDQELVVSRPYHYDRVKQGIVDYHIEKIIQEGTIGGLQGGRRSNSQPPFDLLIKTQPARLDGLEDVFTYGIVVWKKIPYPMIERFGSMQSITFYQQMVGVVHVLLSASKSSLVFKYNENTSSFHLS